MPPRQLRERASIKVLVAGCCVAACSNDAAQIDAPRPIDSRPVDSHLIDAVVHHDAGPDAHVFMDAPITSTVHVVPGCTGVGAGDIAIDITTVGISFDPTTATIAAGKFVRFTTTGGHNFQSRPGAPADRFFVSGPPGPQTSCLQFTVAGSYPFECVVHASMGMTGTLTVN